MPFIDSAAELSIEWTAKIEYTAWSVHQNSKYSANMRYIFTGLDGAQFIPSSQLIIKEEGIPLTITETVVSPVKDRFRSEQISDPFVEINDKLASVEKNKTRTRRLSKRMIERSWTETINRTIKIENKTGKKVTLELTTVDKPAEELRFVSSDPEPSDTEPPEYIYRVELEQEEVQNIKLELTLKKLEKLELPPEQVKVRRGQQDFKGNEPQIQQQVQAAPNLNMEQQAYFEEDELFMGEEEAYEEDQ